MCMCTHVWYVCMHTHTHRSQRTAWESWFSSSTMRAPGMELRSLGFVVSTFSHWAILPILNVIKLKMFRVRELERWLSCCTGCSSSGSEFNSQQPLWQLKPSVMGADALFWNACMHADKALIVIKSLHKYKFLNV